MEKFKELTDTDEIVYKWFVDKDKGRSAREIALLDDFFTSRDKLIQLGLLVREGKNIRAITPEEIVRCRE